MPTYTTNYGFYKAAEGDGETNGLRWADGLNGTLDSIDSLIKTLHDRSARASVTATTSSLAPGAIWNGTITLAKVSASLRLTTSRPCIVRAYGSAAARTADSTRPPMQYPAGGSGIQFQGTTTASLLSFVTQAAIANDDGTVSNTIYLAVTNQDNATGTIDITFSHLPLEY